MKAEMLTFRKTMYNETDENANSDLTPLNFRVVLEVVAL